MVIIETIKTLLIIVETKLVTGVVEGVVARIMREIAAKAKIPQIRKYLKSILVMVTDNSLMI